MSLIPAGYVSDIGGEQPGSDPAKFWRCKGSHKTFRVPKEMFPKAVVDDEGASDFMNRNPTLLTQLLRIEIEHNQTVEIVEKIHDLKHQVLEFDKKAEEEAKRLVEEREAREAEERESQEKVREQYI